MKDKRFRLNISQPHDSYEIIDNVESEEKNALCIYNDLGCWGCSSAPALCDLLNKLDEENNELHEENQQYQVWLDALKEELSLANRDNTALEKENKDLKKEEELFFKQVFDILLKYQDLFNREMADEVLEELDIELTRWFE